MLALDYASCPKLSSSEASGEMMPKFAMAIYFIRPILVSAPPRLDQRGMQLDNRSLTTKALVFAF